MRPASAARHRRPACTERLVGAPAPAASYPVQGPPLSAPDSPPWRGLTLLETMLAIALSSLVLYLVSMAIDLHLRALDQRGQQVEEAQLARTLLGLMARDLRDAVYTPSTNGQSLQAAEGDANGDGQDVDSGESSTSSDTSLGLSDLSYVPTKPGLYGTYDEIQVDISRLPRADEYQRLFQDERTDKLRDMVSEVKTVAYYVRDDNTIGSTTGYASEEREAGGLFRRELDRRATVWAAEAGNVTSLDETAELIAPEVMALQFRYFDGIQWYDEWDSETYGGLPAAVEITIAISSASSDGSGATGLTASNASGDAFGEDQTYRLLVRLPTAEVTSPYDTLETEDTSL